MGWRLLPLRLCRPRSSTHQVPRSWPRLRWSGPRDAWHRFRTTRCLAPVSAPKLCA